MAWNGLQTDQWRAKLDKELSVVGFRLEAYNEDLPEEIVITQIDNEHSYRLEVTYLQELGWFAAVQSNRSGESLAHFHLDDNRKYEKSFFDVWIDWIVTAMQTASSNTGSKSS